MITFNSCYIDDNVSMEKWFLYLLLVKAEKIKALL